MSTTTVPYPSQLPIDEMDTALAHLRVLQAACTADEMRMVDVSAADIVPILAVILDTLDPIRNFLAENDFEKVRISFLECRRQSIEKRGGTQ